jgi:hypothetical protein
LKSHRQHQLQFLKWMRDSLETRLAAVNAAIATMERQLSEEETSNSPQSVPITDA